MFVARDLDGQLYLFNSRPTIIKDGCFQPESDDEKLHISDDWYTDITYGNSPKFISLMTDEGVDLYYRLVKAYAVGNMKIDDDIKAYMKK